MHTISARPTRTRFVVLAFLALGTMINYLDRTILGIAAPTLSRDLGLGPVAMGVLLSAFAWTYTVCQIPGGMFLDRVGSRLTYAVAVGVWSIFILLQGAAMGFYSLLGCRLGLGVAEAPCFPANSRIVGTWFPPQERARATSVYTVGEYLGLALFGPLLIGLMAAFGWRSLFLVTGSVGVLFSVLWWIVYREPLDSKSTNHAELTHIGISSGNAAAMMQTARFSWGACRRVLALRPIWAIGLSHFASNFTLTFFLTWFPTYLATERHMAWVKVGLFSILPYLGGAAGVVVGGWVSDYLLRRTESINIARKGPVIAGFVLASLTAGVSYIQDDRIVILFLSFAFFGQGLVGLGWSIIADIAPAGLGGLTGGLFNLILNLSGIIAPIAIGIIVGFTGSFKAALLLMSVASLFATVPYIFWLGDLKRLSI